MRAFTPGRPSSVLYGVTAEQVAEWTGVHITTARRWKRGEEPPRTAQLVIDLMTGGDLAMIDPAWSGWSLIRGELVAPNGERFTPGDVLASSYWRTLAKSYQVEQRLPRQADWVDEEWKPAKAAEA